MCFFNCFFLNVLVVENFVKRSEGVEKMEDFFGIEEDDEINNDVLEVDDDYCVLISEDFFSIKYGLFFVYLGGKDESMEKNKECILGLGKIILLLNN